MRFGLVVAGLAVLGVAAVLVVLVAETRYEALR